MAADVPDLTFVYHEVHAETAEKTFTEITASLEQYNEAFIFVVSKPAAWHAYGLPENLSGFVSAITESVHTTLVSLGDHYVLQAYPNAARTLCAYSDVPASQEAVAQKLFSVTS